MSEKYYNVYCIVRLHLEFWLCLCSCATRNPRAIVITPTRELCIQVSKWVSAWSHSKPVRKWSGYDPHSKCDLIIIVNTHACCSCDNTHTWHAGWVQLITTATCLLSAITQVHPVFVSPGYMCFTLWRIGLWTPGTWLVKIGQLLWISLLNWFRGPDQPLKFNMRKMKLCGYDQWIACTNERPHSPR